MPLLSIEFFGCFSFQQIDQLFDAVLMPGDDEMNVFGENGAGLNGDAALARRIGEPQSDGAGLFAAEDDGRIFERSFCCKARSTIVPLTRNRAASLCLCCLTKLA